MSVRDDFPLFSNNPGLVYLDSAATTQKPSYVIDGICYFLEHDYANIHRGRYSLSEKSEELFWQARKKVAKFFNADEEEIIFASNSTSASNLLVQSLIASDMLQAGDTVVLSPLEHHANIVPWMMAAERVGCQIERLQLTDDLSLDLDDIVQKCQGAKVLALTYVSNVTGEIFDVQKIGDSIPEDCLFVVDASQAAPHIPVNVQKIGCDFLRCTGHKMMASTGIGILYGRKEHLEHMTPSRGGGSAISSVTREEYELMEAPDKFEPGTPNLVGIVSLLKALEYIETLGGSVAIGAIEEEICANMISGLLKLQETGKLQLLGPQTMEKRVGVFSFVLDKTINPHQLGQWMADRDICIRCGGLCAQPLHEKLGEQGSCRVSLYIYNTTEDVDRFLQALQEFLQGTEA